MLRKRRRISDSVDDDPMGGLNNLSDAMLVLALGFLIFAIMALSANPDMITQSQTTQDVSTADTFTQNYSDAGGLEDSGYSEVGAVVGATYPQMGETLRRIMPKSYILVPGYGAQGGTAQGVAGMFDKDGMGALVNSSRGIIGAWKKSGKYSESMSADDALDLVAESAREAAKDMRDNLRAVLS